MTWKRIALLTLGLLTLSVWVRAQDNGSEDPADRTELRPRRLYFGSPPAVPHETGGLMGECLMCHGPGSFAPETPHPTRIACRQCHVSAATQTAPFRGSRFVGLIRPPVNTQAQSGIPPAMAHSALLHENCLACHAPGAREEVISTPHPERAGCPQCHLPQELRVPEVSR